MPELPEVEVVKQSLEKYVLNKKILKIVVKNKNLRYPVPENISKKLVNLKIQKVKRISKYLAIEFKNQIFLLIHLGMSGTLHLIKDKNNNFQLIEVNTIPGLTNSSLVPKSAKFQGIDFKTLVATILNTAC